MPARSVPRGGAPAVVATATLAADGPPSERPLRRDADANRRRVLEAAAEVFAADGLDVPVEDIAHSAGVGMGTLYRRFPNKEALIDQLVHDLFEGVLVAGRRAAAATDGSGLETFVRDTASLHHLNRGCVSRMWTRPIPEAFTAELDSLLAELLRQAQAAGLVRSDCVLTDIVVVFWAIRGIIESTGDAAPEAWQRHVDVVFAGLRPGAATLPHPALTPGQRDAITRWRLTQP